MTSTLALLLACSLGQPAPTPKRILLRSSWQTVNIGDIAHTPGVLALLEKHLPQVEVRLWPSNVGNGVDEMLRRRFPKLTIVQGAEALKAAFAECDFLLHGSGPSLVAQNDVARWRRETGKPYGVYGITVSNPIAETMDVLSGARFVFCRDGVSLKLIQDKGCRAPVVEFGPDGAFACDLRNDQAARAFLAANSLEEGKFLCALGRLRFTPYWLIHNKPETFNAERHARNEALADQDHAALREAICGLVRETGLKVLVCPEDQSQMAVTKRWLVDPLPADVRAKVVWRERYWLTDEALSVYRRSAGLFGNEMHSPIMCVGNGIPAIVCRWAEQTSKGFMWRDIGLGDWLFDQDSATDRARIGSTVLAMAKDLPAARAKAAAAREVVLKRQRETMAILARELGVQP